MSKTSTGKLDSLAGLVNDNGDEKCIESAIVPGSRPIGLDGHQLMRWLGLTLNVSADNFLVGQIGLGCQASEQRFKLVVRDTDKGKRLIENCLEAAFTTDAPESFSHARQTYDAGGP